ncbi:MAG: host specificity protein, partial [Alphaproteobacteria bacterium]|nr:host specificity protein [Alphaproteobacteria bacterium]
MATMVLAAVGGALGASVGGGVAGVGAAVLGRVLGGVAGGLIDQKILGGGARVLESGRIGQVRVMGSREGAAIPRIYGRMRLSGQVIWASRFRERSTVSGGGGKGAAPRTRSFSYAISLALALCEGPVARIGRIWADGKPFDASRAEVRLHRGGEDQAPDPLIEAVEGAGA